MRKCIIAGCENLLTNKARLEECQQCRHMFRYWFQKTPTQVVERREALLKWQNRMRRLVTLPKGKKHAKAIKTPIHRRRTEGDRQAL